MLNDAENNEGMWVREVSDSELSAVGEIGFVALDGMLAEGVLETLRKEAVGSLGSIKRARKTGALSYSAGITTLGPLAKRILNSLQMHRLLEKAFGRQFTLTENMSCLTEYRKGDQLGAHLDQPAKDCSATVILYLDATGDSGNSLESGLQLKIYGDTQASVNAPPKAIIKTVPDRLVLGRGSEIWHERPPLKENEWVLAITACFKVE